MGKNLLRPEVPIKFRTYLIEKDHQKS